MVSFLKKWVLKRNKVDAKKMGNALGISDVTAYIMANRGIGTFNEAIKFLSDDLNFLSDIKEMKDICKSCDIIISKINNNKKIAIYGDYDVDGVMSTVILYTALKECDADVMYYIPDRRKEGYGLNKNAIKELYDIGVDTILTCDNGIAAIDEIEFAKGLGLTVIIIDHHEPAFDFNDENKKNILPIADAIIDPKQNDCSYKFKKMCAAGISYRFVIYLLDILNIKTKKLNDYVTFAGIATICDIVDLLSENRIIVKNCLKNINNTDNIGLKALIKVCELENKILTEYHIGFIIGPCINATGRLENAKLSAQLFVEQDMEKAYEFAKLLYELNNDRKELTIRAANEAIEYIENSDFKYDNIFVIYNNKIHESVAGIVAGRIKDKFYKPVIVLTDTDEIGIVKGSGRSIECYNIFEELLKCKDLFLKFGGHSMAAGLSLSKENVDILRDRLNRNFTFEKSELIQTIKIEKELDLDEITIDIAKDIKVLSPFGKENNSPLFGTKRVLLEKIYIIGKNKNIIKFIFRSKTNKILYGVSFDCYESFIKQIKNLYDNEIYDKILCGNIVNIYIDIIYSIDINIYKEVESVQLNIKDIRL